MNYKALAEKIRFYKTTEKEKIALVKKLEELLKDDFSQ